MDYHFKLNRKIRLNKDSEHNSLYSWSLQELNEEGEDIGNNQIPWEWSLYFIASELRHNYSINMVNNTALAHENEFITAILHSDDVSYSMFGTNRRINQFSLRIRKFEEGNACCLINKGYPKGDPLPHNSCYRTETLLNQIPSRNILAG